MTAKPDARATIRAERDRLTDEANRARATLDALMARVEALDFALRTLEPETAAEKPRERMDIADTVQAILMTGRRTISEMAELIERKPKQVEAALERLRKADKVVCEYDGEHWAIVRKQGEAAE